MARRLIAAGVIRTAGGKTTTLTRTDNGTPTGAVSGRIVPAARKESK